MTAKHTHGPYRQRLNADPSPPPPRTRPWVVGMGALIALGLAVSPPWVPRTVAHPVDTRPVRLPYRVLHHALDEVEPLRDAAFFEASREGLVVRTARGATWRVPSSPEGARDVAVAIAEPVEASLGATSVVGVRLDGDGWPPCLVLDERWEDCGIGHRIPIQDHVASERTPPTIEPTRCRIEAGLVRCRGGLASGRVALRERPMPIVSDLRFVALGAADRVTCGVTTDHEVRCWGPAVYAIEETSDAQSVAMRSDLGCALLGGGEVSCWRIDDAPGAATATRIEGLPPAVQIAANATATCALDAEGVVRCWGRFGHAWPGHPRAYRATAPLDVRLPERATRLVPTAHEVMCARLASGPLRCWGGPADAWSDERPNETLGDTAEEESWAVDEAGADADVARLDDGRVLVHDDNTPQGWSVLGDLPPVRAVASSEIHHCALADDGRAWCWGDNRNGELGLDDAVDEDAWTVVQIARR